ncbi:MAG: N-formylglutamate amidohydrolase [Xanthobacteraceae bacterium]|nr:MAG: N-formylglutamate amidohydrolase [Xanthobacteraceae bacterium]
MAAQTSSFGDFAPPFEIREPRGWQAPVVFNSPHSGAVYPEVFLRASRLDLHTLRKSEDSYVDEFIAGLVEQGFATMQAYFPRSYVDVNREPYELDPRMFSGRLPSFANTRSMRVAGGLGTIPRVVGDGHEIYAAPIAPEEALGRIDYLYKPYHRALRRMLAQVHRRFGAVILVDCHSMPSTGSSRDEPPRPDVVLGDRYGASCTPALTFVIETLLQDLGYRVGRNKPYAGGFITEHYGNPANGYHTIQIELNRAVYLDERRLVRKPRFSQVVDDFAKLAPAIAAVARDLIEPCQAAAE